MVVRLLLAVLMLTGLVPVRVCTCVAATHPAAAPVKEATHPATEKSRCGCRSESKPAAFPDPARVDSPMNCHDHHSIPHEASCPAMNPLPTLEPALPSADPVPSAVLDLALTLWNAPYALGPIPTVSPPHFPPHVGALPRYLELLTLRI